MLRSMLRDIRDTLCDDEALIEQYVRKEGLSPLEVLVERESRQEIIYILNAIDKYLDPDDRKILELWVIDGKDQKQIGEILGLTQQAISYRIRVMPDKIARHVCEIPFFDLYYQSELFTEKPYQTHNQTNLLGFPFEHLSKLGNGGYWGQYKGRKVYQSRSICKVPEYLAGAFDDKTVCTYCKRCKRRDAFADEGTDIF